MQFDYKNVHPQLLNNLYLTFKATKNTFVLLLTIR